MAIVKSKEKLVPIAVERKRVTNNAIVRRVKTIERAIKNRSKGLFQKNEANKINSNNFTRSNRVKFNINAIILE